MLLKRQTVAAGAIGTWIPVNRRSFGNIGFTVAPNTSATGTYDVQFTESNIQRGTDNVVLSRSTTTLTVNLVNHGLVVGDEARIVQSTDYDAFHVVATVVDADSFTATVAASGTSVRGTVIPIVVDDVSGFSGAAGKQSGIVDASVVAVRLDATGISSAPIDILVNQFES